MDEDRRSVVARLLVAATQTKSQASVARSLEMHRARLHQLINDHREPTRAEYIRLADFFEVELGWLLREDEKARALGAAGDDDDTDLGRTMLFMSYQGWFRDSQGRLRNHRNPHRVAA